MRVSVAVAPPRVAGLGLRADKGVVKGGAGGGAVLAPGTVVQGARTQVMMGSEVDLARVAASIQPRSPPEPAAEPGAGAVSGARQLRSLAGAITGAAANIKSKLTSAVTQGSLARSSPSPPDTSQGQGQGQGQGRVKMREVPIRVEAGAGQGQGLPGQEKSPHVIPLTVPGAEYGGSLELTFSNNPLRSYREYDVIDRLTFVFYFQVIRTGSTKGPSVPVKPQTFRRSKNIYNKNNFYLNCDKIFETIKTIYKPYNTLVKFHGFYKLINCQISISLIKCVPLYRALFISV